GQKSTPVRGFCRADTAPEPSKRPDVRLFLVHCRERQSFMITYVDAETKTRRTAGVIPLHGREGFEGMRKAGGLTAQALDLLVDHVRPGVTTAFLDKLAYDFAMDHGAVPAPPFPQGYRRCILRPLTH